jgi:hypothetical protein
MKPFHPPFPNFIPSAFFLELDVSFLEIPNRKNWAHGYKADFALLQITALGNDNQVENIYGYILGLWSNGGIKKYRDMTIR